ncbi:MAG: ATP-binding protein [Spirochaetales bacterium]|nr:ATP-binding protein [Spirochaetales bacterium]
MKRRTLPGTIYPFLVILTILPLILLYIVSTGSVSDIFNDQIYKTIRETAYLVRNVLPFEDISDKEIMTAFSINISENTDFRITVMLPDGVVTGDSHIDPEKLENHISRMEVQKALAGKEGFSERFSTSLNMKMYYFALPVKTDKGIAGVIRISLPMEISGSILKTTYLKIFLILLVIAVSVLLMNYYITRSISRPVKLLEIMSNDISSLDFSSLKTIDGPLEIYNLSLNLKKMSGILEQKFNSANRRRMELNTVFSALIESIIVVDKNFIIKDINNAALELFKADSARGKSLIQVTLNRELIETAEKTLLEKSSQNRTIHLKEQFNNKSDEFGNNKFTSRDIYLQINTAIIETEDLLTRIIVVLHDITQIKTLERIRKDFVANVSHELKTPVTSILGFVETLKDGAINNSQDTHEFLDIIESQSRRLDTIIRDLLSLSKLESFENTPLDLADITLAASVSSAFKNCSKRIQAKDIVTEMLFPENLLIKVNPSLFEQALINLIDNAVKYCPEQSTITISGEAFKDYTLIKISDNGPGIPGKDIPRVFERFYTVNKARSRELGGTGLGLAIVKHIILAHRGEINLVSSQDSGTEFIIRIPS